MIWKPLKEREFQYLILHFKTAEVLVTYIYFSLPIFILAELIIAEVISLSRRLTDKVKEMHAGTWDKVKNILAGNI